MRAFTHFLIPLMVGASVLFVSTPAFAETVLFNDDFESQPAPNVNGSCLSRKSTTLPTLIRNYAS